MSDASKKLATYMLLGQMMHDQEAAAGLRKPDIPQLQLTGEGWRIWGGDVEEPADKTVAEAYLGVLKHGSVEQAQGVLDMTRERCGELRLAAKSARGKDKKKVEDCYASLRKELDEAIEIKIEKGIVTI